jgi:hypothetical protein
LADWKHLRELVLARCQGYCEFCGIGLSEDFALHHRKFRSRGGKDIVSNLIALHHNCHNLGTSSVHLNIKKATESGHVVSRHAEPIDIPLLLPNGSVVTLTDEGSYSYIERKEGYGW